MKRSDLIQNLSIKFDSIPKNVVVEMVETVFDEIGNALSDGKSIQLRNYLHLSTKVDKPTRRRNPRTGETFILADRNRIVFKPGLEMNEAVRKYKENTS